MTPLVKTEKASPGESSPGGGRWARLAAGLARSRLVQFLALGACIFAIARKPAESRRIHIDAATLSALRAEHARRLGASALSPEEEQLLLRRLVEDEILAREARRLGLDVQDDIVKKRLIQKVLFLAEDLGGASRSPTEEELRGYFARNGSRYLRPATLRFVHVFASTRESAEKLRAPVAAFAAGAPSADAVPPLGEPFLAPRRVAADEAEVTAIYGAVFAGALRGLPPGAWSGPVASKFGWHLVRLIEREPERPRTFDEARELLPLDYLIARREEAIARYLTAAFPRYRVDVEGKPMRELLPTRRTAIHAQPSGED